MSFPGLDVVFRLAAPAVELLVQRSATAMAEVGDDEAGIGAVGTGLDAGDDAADPAPAAGGVMELLEAADLARGRRGLRPAVLSSRPPTWRFKVRVGARPRT